MPRRSLLKCFIHYAIPVYLYLSDLQFHAVQDCGSSSGRDGIQHTEPGNSLVLNFKPMLESEVQECSIQNRCNTRMSKTVLYYSRLFTVIISAKFWPIRKLKAQKLRTWYRVDYPTLFNTKFIAQNIFDTRFTANFDNAYNTPNQCCTSSYLFERWKSPKSMMIPPADSLVLNGR